METPMDFVKDIADHGIRFDLNPTIQWDPNNSASIHEAYCNYLRRIDQRLRERANKSLVVNN